MHLVLPVTKISKSLKLLLFYYLTSLKVLHRPSKTQNDHVTLKSTTTTTTHDRYQRDAMHRITVLIYKITNLGFRYEVVVM